MNDQIPISTSPTPPRRIPAYYPTVQPWITYVILAIITAVFFYQQSLNPFEQNLFVLRWAKVNQAIYDGEYYRLITAMFLHADLTHLLFNGLALYLFGREVERTFGHIRFIIIYFLGGISGSIASLLWLDNISLGASGAIFAIFSAVAVYYYLHIDVLGPIARIRVRNLVVLGALNIAYGFAPNTYIDNAAHIGGLSVGFLLAWLISPKFVIGSYNRDKSYEILSYFRAPEENTLIARMIPDAVYMQDTNPLRDWVYVPFVMSAAIIAVLAVVNGGQ
ncbi:MAG: rhomboid family intramembrane serine protease [Phototrophicales bacterium]|nr:MAG: rhomboid family intramembrane serine protease [Phototrophicales bacterium]